MAVIAQTPATLDIVAVKGDDLTVTLSVTESSVAYDWTGATVATAILDSTGATVATNFTTVTPANGTLTMSLTDTNTTTLGVGSYRYWLSVTKSSATRTWLAGLLTVMETGWGGTSSSSASLSITTGSATINISSINVTATGVSVADTAGYYTATNVETVLAEQAVNRLRDLTLPVKPTAVKLMSNPPTVGALATSTAIVSPQYHYTVSGPSSPTQSVNTAFFTTSVGSDWSMVGSTFPNYNYAQQILPTVGAGSGLGVAEFIHYGTTFELMFKGVTGYLQISVDGELVSATPTSIANNGSTYFLPITFATAAHRTIKLEFFNLYFGGVVLGPTDAIGRAVTNRPKVLVIGDSFTEGSGSSYYVDGWVPTLGRLLGWDVWSSGQGGSGYVAPGNYTGKFSTRLSFYANIDFDVIVVAGGINDCNATYAGGVATEAASLYSTIKSTWPTATWIATSPLINKGVEGWTSYYHSVRQTLASAASTAGFNFVDLMEMPINGSTPVTGTISNSPSAGATTFQSALRVPIGSTVEIGTGLSTVERRRVTSTSGVGPYTMTVAALSNAHTAGETLEQVGNSMWTGTGRVGATTGSGNCDVYVSSDGTHPSSAGHQAIANTAAGLIADILNPYT